MYSRLVIDGNAVYEIDEECVQKKKNRGYKDPDNVASTSVSAAVISKTAAKSIAAATTA